MVYQIAYCSNAVRILSPKVIGDILDVSRRNNARDGSASRLTPPPVLSDQST